MSAFEAIYKEHVDAVFRFVTRAVGRRDIAEEITGDVFVALFQSMDTIDRSQLPGWLFAVARNRATDYWRHRAVETRYATRPVDPPATREPFQDAWIFEHKALKPIHRVCLVLRYVHGMSRAEIARRIGQSAIQIKGHLQYARRILKREFEKNRK